MSSPSDLPTGTQYSLRAGDQHASIVSVGGGVRSYEVSGRAVLRGYAETDPPPMASGIVLVPWPNRIAGARYRFDGAEYQLAVTEPAAGNAIHGLARRAAWEAVETAADSVTLQHVVTPEEGYPFTIRISTRWSVGPDGLRADHAAVNTGDAPAPFGLGVHPYFDLHGGSLEETTLRLPVERYLVTDERDIPTGSSPVAGSDVDFRDGRALGSTRLNTPFAGFSRAAGGRAEVVVGGPGRAPATLWLDPALDFVQVFTPDDVLGAGPAIAVEPMSCAPDAFNSGDGLVVLEPGQEWHGSWGVKSA
ncbi:MAG TPA: aldose 1-epimerase family protein [Mycobacteriales bacterium]|nr:aldose 1-epimerase family protein [Mycobacteriales bacterium]